MSGLGSLNYDELIPVVVAASQVAGAAIMEIYRSAIAVSYKTDRSPVTAADRASEEIILDHLARAAPEIPVVAEERAASGAVPDIGRRFFLIDPLDGTKEYLKRNGEFTINIALVDGDKPVFGLIYAPDAGECYLTLAPDRAARIKMNPTRSPPAWRTLNVEALPLRPAAARPPIALMSRSVLTAATEELLSRQFPGLARRQVGSSLKFAVLARGDADVYPRLGPTSEWDTAAGHALLNATGGCVLAETGGPLRYGKREQAFTNPGFVAWRSAAEAAARGFSS